MKRLFLEDTGREINKTIPSGEDRDSPWNRKTFSTCAEDMFLRKRLAVKQIKRFRPATERFGVKQINDFDLRRDLS